MAVLAVWLGGRVGVQARRGRLSLISGSLQRPPPSPPRPQQSVLSACNLNIEKSIQGNGFITPLFVPEAKERDNLIWA